MEKFVAEVSDWLYVLLLGSFGGAAGHLFLNRGKRFAFWLFLSNMFISAFAAKAIGGFVPASDYRDSLLMLIGFFAFPILAVLQNKVVDYVEKFFPTGG